MSTLFLILSLSGCGLLAYTGSRMLTNHRELRPAPEVGMAAMASVTGPVSPDALARARRYAANRAETAVQPRRHVRSDSAGRRAPARVEAERDALLRRCHALEVENETLRRQVERLTSGADPDRSGYDPAVIRRIASTTDELRGLLTEVQIGIRE